MYHLSTTNSYLFQRGRRPSTAPSHLGRDHIGRDRPVSGKEQLTLQLQHWSQVPGQYLTHLARSLHSRLSEGNHTEQAQGLALDRWKSFFAQLGLMLLCFRFGQILGAATRRGGGVRPDKELVSLVRDLPRNRLLTIVLSSYS